VTLSVKFRYEWHYADSAEEADELIGGVLGGMKAEHLVHGRRQAPGEIATLISSDRPHSDGSSLPGSMLMVSVNNDTEFGALIWCSTEAPLGESGQDWKVWVSDNPNPPPFDPRVVADPDEYAFHDPRSAIRISDVREAMREFYQSRSGGRPESINWVPGSLDGIRVDG
jgi:hypothetical protein